MVGERWLYFTAAVPSVEATVTVELHRVGGRVELYAHSACLPTRSDHEATSARSGDHLSIVLHPGSPAHRAGTVYVGVRADTTSTFAIRALTAGGDGSGDGGDSGGDGGERPSSPLARVDGTMQRMEAFSEEHDLRSAAASPRYGSRRGALSRGGSSQGPGGSDGAASPTADKGGDEEGAASRALDHMRAELTRREASAPSGEGWMVEDEEGDPVARARRRMPPPQVPPRVQEELTQDQSEGEAGPATTGGDAGKGLLGLLTDRSDASVATMDSEEAAALEEAVLARASPSRPEPSAADAWRRQRDERRRHLDRTLMHRSRIQSPLSRQARGGGAAAASALRRARTADGDRGRGARAEESGVLAGWSIAQLPAEEEEDARRPWRQSGRRPATQEAGRSARDGLGTRARVVARGANYVTRVAEAPELGPKPLLPPSGESPPS